MPAPGLTVSDERPPPELANAFRDVAAAGLRYWRTLGSLALESIAALLAESPAPASPAAGAVPTTILLEAEAGEHALGVFLVENTTGEEVAVPVSVSPFVAPDGREVEPAVRFRPEVVTLAPGDQLLVQVAAGVDETLEPGVRYRAEISVPGLAAGRIPVVVRRRPSAG